MDVRLPDGTIIKNVPEGTTQEDLMERVDAARSQEVADKMTTGERLTAGVGRAFVKGGRAIKEAMDVPAQALENVFGTFRPFGMPSAKESAAGTQAAMQEAERIDRPLMNTTAGKVGDFAGNMAMLLPTAFIPGANTVAGAGAIGGVTNALLTPGGVSDRIVAGGLGAAGGAGGQFIGQKVAGWAGNKLAQRQAQATAAAEQGAVRDSTLKAAQSAGYVVPPSTTNPSGFNRALESVGGKIATQQEASLRNQQVTNKLAREALGLPKDAPLTKAALESLRKKAGTVYGEIEKTGRIVADKQYGLDLLKLSETADRINIDFPDLPVAGKEAIAKLTTSLSKPEFDASSAIAVIKSLRKSGNDNMSKLVAAANPDAAALGKAQLAAAEAVEDQMIRHLESIGRKDLADAFDKARTLIAKTYTVEKALNPDTGNVAARELSKQIKKGKYMTDGLAAAAKFARAFPKAADEVTHSSTVSALDAVTGAGAGLATGNPLAVLGPTVARAGARQTMLSPVYQQLMARPRYAPGMLGSGGLEALQLGGQFGLPLGLLGANAIQK